jgi:hypothetical protein
LKLIIYSCLHAALAFLVNYPQVHDASRGQKSDAEETPSAQIQFLPILCWCSSVHRQPAGGVPSGMQTQAKRIPILVLISFDGRVPQKLHDFWGPRRRQERLNKFEQWVFLDLAATFSGWPTIWTNARLELARRHASMYSSAHAVVDLDTTRVIHQDMANIIALREDLRLFVAAYEKYQKILRRLFPGTGLGRLDKMFPHADGEATEIVSEERKGLSELLDEMEHRLQDTQQNLEHQQETSEVIIRQLENLLSLVCRSILASDSTGEE